MILSGILLISIGILKPHVIIKIPSVIQNKIKKMLPLQAITKLVIQVILNINVLVITILINFISQ